MTRITQGKTMRPGISPPPTKKRKTFPANALTIEASPSKQPCKLEDPHTIRIFSWNVNGIAPFLQKSITTFFLKSRQPQNEDSKEVVPPASLRGFLHRHKWPAVVFLQEVKIATSDRKTQDAVRNAINTRLPSESTANLKGPTYEAHFTLPRDLHNARGLRGNGKVYGVCSIIRSDLRDKFGVNVRTVDWDKEGRISIVELKTDEMRLALFNIYAVNGTSNPYRNPSTGAICGTRHDRKLEVHRLLMEECLELEGAGWNIMLAGDMNVAPSVLDGYPSLRTSPHQHVLNRADFNARFLGGESLDKSKVFDGVDVWRAMHGDERRYTYYPGYMDRGGSCDRVDYVIVGKKSLWDAGLVKDCGILDSVAERGPSDHVPIWVDVILEHTRGEQALKV